MPLNINDASVGPPVESSWLSRWLMRLKNILEKRMKAYEYVMNISMYFFEGEGGIEEWRFETAEAQSNITDLPSEIDFALTED